MNTTVRRRWRNVFLVALSVLAVGIAYAALSSYGIAIPCVFNALTGLLCPGCGNTRAARAFLRLDFSAALSYNLMAPVEFFYIAWVLFFTVRSYLKGNGVSYRPPAVAFDVCVLVLILAWGILRNIL